MSYRDTVKPWFETGDKPTQAQFYALFDHLRFTDDPIAQADISGLIAALILKASQSSLDDFTGGELLIFVADNYYDIPVGYLLEKFIVVPDAGSDIKIGTTVGGDEIAPVETIAGGTGEPYEVNVFAYPGNKRIYFTGIIGNTRVIIFKRMVKLI
jgi:hypothetical protein